MKNEALFDRILQDIGRMKRPLVVGLNGAYTSGKTMLADGLEAFLQANDIRTQMLHYDDFHRPFSAIEWTADTEVEAFYHRAFDPYKLVREVLWPFKERGELKRELACIDLGTGQYTNLVRLNMDQSTVVLLEGVLLFRPPLLDFLDYKIFLDVSREEILRRARLRDVPRFGEAIYEKFLTRYLPVQQRYVEEHAPAEQADLVIDNNDYENPVMIP